MNKVFTILLLFAFSKAFSQSGMPPVYVIKIDTALVAALPDSCWQMLEDKGNKLTIGQVSSFPVSGNFHFDIAKKVDYAIHTNWFRFRLKNGMAHEAKICFWGFLEQSDYYYKSDSTAKFVHKANGRLTSWSRKDGLKEWGLVPIVLQPGQEITVYLRAYNTYRFYFEKPDKFSPIFVFTDRAMQSIYQYDEENYKIIVYDSFLFGFLLFACILNLVFFYIVREKVYLFYSIYLFVMGVGRFINELHRLFFTEHETQYAYLNTLYWWAATFFLAYFVRYLLKTYQYYPRWDKVLLTLAWILPLLQVIKFFIGPSLALDSYLLSQEIIDIENLILVFAVLISFLFFVRDVKRSTRLLLITVLPWVAIWILCNAFSTIFSVLHKHFNLSYPAWVTWIGNQWFIIENFTLSLMVISFSFNLFLRFYNLKKENARQALETERLAKEKEIERNELIEQQKIELEKTVEERTAELKHSLVELKATQSQLIQSEKMASLGELTAGIAHEIQNPLNFVNNFSEVNIELIAELTEERRKPEKDEALQDELIAGIKVNLSKVIHHGQRADFIVKGMLEHSRTSTGEKQLTDLNVLCDEFLKLSYHGLRAKDKSFNAEMVTNFDKNLPKVNVSQQDIGRVMLNLFNNAFYAVNQKAKTAGADYKPTVEINTSLVDGQILISVMDNGNGIPEAIKDKIMQPFFTTKPTGEGTGLGLSLSYDIMKAHGGQITVATSDNKFTKFMVSLPLN